MFAEGAEPVFEFENLPACRGLLMNRFEVFQFIGLTCIQKMTYVWKGSEPQTFSLSTEKTKLSELMLN